MKKKFASLIKEASVRKKSRIVLALDPDPNKIARDNMLEYLTSIIDAVNEDIIAVKLNMHVLLPLSNYEISKIVETAHRHDIAAIADIKLNDIPHTNQIVIYNLASMNFNAVIINPFIGFHALHETIDYANLEEMGIITLVFMSHKGAENTFGLKVGEKHLYDIFLEWSVKLDVDGIVVGATYPDIIKHCYNLANGKAIYSPGVVTQGGDPMVAIKHGVDYLIVGRSIIDANDPVRKSKELKEKTWNMLY
ncbi:MAG: orotidine 5'-phosphate decarboxylase [Candidatus Nitrosocaldaceae archaeon]